MRPLPITDKGGVLVITLDDPAALNEGQAAGLRQALYAKIESLDAPRVAIDLSAIDYISSTGIALMIGTKRRVEARMGRLALFGLRPEVLDLFHVMKLANLFEIADDQDQALEFMSSPPSN